MPPAARPRALLPVLVLIASVVAPLALAQPPGFPRPNIPPLPKPPNIPRPEIPKPPEFQKVWTCSNCRNEWPDEGGPPPSNCPKCGVSFINGGPKPPEAPKNPNTPNPNPAPNAVPTPNAGGMPNVGPVENSWTCQSCRHSWTTTGAAVPEKCPKCRAFFDKIVNPDGTTTTTRHGRIGTYIGIGTAAVVLIAVLIKGAVSMSAGGSTPRKRKKKKRKPVRRPRDDDDDDY